MNNTCYWFRDLWVIPFFNQSIRFFLCSLVVFFTSLVTLRGRLDCPSCAVGTSVQRSKEFHSGTGRDFCKIPGSRDFPGRDLRHIFIPGFFGNCSGFFGIFLFDTIGDQFKHFSRAGKPNKHFFHQKNRPANCRRDDLQRFAHAL